MKLEDYQASINQKLSSYLDHQIKLASLSETKTLLKKLKQVTASGKRFRPGLFFLIYKAYGGKDDTLNLGLSLELLHQALMIHDDIIDEDITRHRKRNITGLYLEDKTLKNTNVPASMSLLAGDLLLSTSNQLVLRDTKLTDQNKLKALSLFNASLTRAIYGQQLDTLNVGSLTRLMTEAQLENIIVLKTVSYSTDLPTKLAALLVDLQDSELKKLADFSISLGTYLQLLNDYADYFQETNSNFGLQDFSRGKISYPFLAAKKLVTKSDLQTLLSLSKKKLLTNADKSKILNILKKSGVQRASRDLVDSYYRASLGKLSKLAVKNQSRVQLLELIDNLKRV